MGFLSEHDLKNFGFKSLGKNVLISDKASFYNPSTISIESNVRIDDYCILSGNIKLGSYIHISAYCGLYGKGGIEMKDFTGLSPRCTLFSASDDFSGNFMIGPLINEKFTNVNLNKIEISKFVQIGSGTTILPGVFIGEGSVIGAMSLVKTNIEEWKVYAGNPLRYLKPRNNNVIALSELFLEEEKKTNKF